jgi:hypothetical protein
VRDASSPPCPKPAWRATPATLRALRPGQGLTDEDIAQRLARYCLNLLMSPATACGAAFSTSSGLLIFVLPRHGPTAISGWTDPAVIAVVINAIIGSSRSARGKRSGRHRLFARWLRYATAV